MLETTEDAEDLGSGHSAAQGKVQFNSVHIP